MANRPLVDLFTLGNICGGERSRQHCDITAKSRCYLGAGGDEPGFMLAAVIVFALAMVARIVNVIVELPACS